MNAQTVLVIDDEIDILNIFKNILEADGFNVYTSANAVKGLDLAKTIKPDVIITDIMMPGMTGIQFIETIRKEDEIKNTKIIVITAGNLHEAEEQAKQLNVDDFLLKPLDFHQIREKIRKPIK